MCALGGVLGTGLGAAASAEGGPLSGDDCVAVCPGSTCLGRLMGVVLPVKRGSLHAGGADAGALAMLPRGMGGDRCAGFEGV